jgi:hypothetical protein
MDAQTARQSTKFILLHRVEHATFSDSPEAIGFTIVVVHQTLRGSGKQTGLDGRAKQQPAMGNAFWPKQQNGGRPLESLHEETRVTIKQRRRIELIWL